MLTYQIQLPEGTDVHGMFLKLKQLEEEEPELHIVWNESLSEIHAQVMGEVQIEILKSLIEERFDVKVEFGEGNIVYKETIEAKKLEELVYKLSREFAAKLQGEKYSEITSVTFGIARIMDTKDKDFEKLYSNADKALYVAKNRSKNNWYIL